MISKKWEKGDRCWFWMRRPGRPGRSYRQYATVIESNEEETLTRLRADNSETIIRPTNRLNEVEPR